MEIFYQMEIIIKKQFIRRILKDTRTQTVDNDNNSNNKKHHKINCVEYKHAKVNVIMAKGNAKNKKNYPDMLVNK